MAKIITIHHMASTGGSLLCKYIQKNCSCVLLSEINYSAYCKLSNGGRSLAAKAFAPDDMLLKYWGATGNKLDIKRLSRFKVDLQLILSDLDPDRALILRDWTHGDFFLDEPEAQSSLHECLINAGLEFSSIVTVRHPLESYCSVMGNHSQMFHSIRSLDDYACRYLRMLEVFKNAPMFYYEKACSGIKEFVLEVASITGLTVDKQSFDYDISDISMSGDSGRSQSVAMLRPAKDWKAYIDKSELNASSSYKELCKMLGYEPYLIPGLPNYFRF